MLKRDKYMRVLPHVYQNPYPENKTNLDFSANRNEMVFENEEERKYNPKKEKSQDSLVQNGQRQ